MLVAIPGWRDLTEDRRRRLVSDIRTVVRMTGLPAGDVVMTPVFLRAHVLNDSAAQHGVSEPRMRNLRSSVRFVLRRLGLLDPKEVALLQAWLDCFDRLKGHGRLEDHGRNGLIGIARFGSAREIPPERIHLEGPAFLTHLTERTVTPRPRKTFGRMRQLWNRCCQEIEGWPGQPLPRPDGRAETFILPPTAFPEPFQRSLVTLGDQLTAAFPDDPYEDTPDLLDNGGGPTPSHCPKPLRLSSAKLRQDHARWAASALVATGFPIEQVTLLACLVVPTERARDTLRHIYRSRGEKPSAAGMHVAEVLCMIAKYHVCLPEQEVAKIRRWGAVVRLNYRGMTPKNQAAVCAAMLPEHERKLRELPAAFFAAARKLLAKSPRQACSLAMRGTAVLVFSRRLLRLDNARKLEYRHLQRDDPKRGRISRVAIPAEETKNTKAIDQPVAPDIAAVLQEWTDRFRPVIALPGCPYLFPGKGGNKPIGAQGLRSAVKSATKNYVGVELSPHQFRHLGARTLLEEFPGQYETVSKALGNTPEVVVRSYSGTEDEAIMRRFDDVVLGRARRLKRPPGKKGSPGKPSRWKI